MWIDDSSADVIKIDFDVLYHGDVLVEGDTSEQLDDWHPLAPLSDSTAGHPQRASLLPRSRQLGRDVLIVI